MQTAQAYPAADREAEDFPAACMWVAGWVVVLENQGEPEGIDVAYLK